MPLEPQSDLQWTAFLYVAGDLPPDEFSKFERLLSEDQEAREALASAVELAQVLAILGDGRTSRIRATPRRRTWKAIAWIGSVATAACLAALLIPTRPPGSSSSEVARAWTGLRKAPDAEWTALGDGPHPADPIDTVSSSVVEDEESNGRALPSWLLTAASVPRPEANQEEN